MSDPKSFDLDLTSDECMIIKTSDEWLKFLFFFVLFCFLNDISGLFSSIVL